MSAALDRLRLDQVVMEFSLRGGIEAVAFELQRAFRSMGVDCRVVTSVSDEVSSDVTRIAPLVSRIGTRGRWRHIGRAIAVPLFTLAATGFIRAARRGPDRLVISHGDTLAGDVCVVHAVNRANIDAKRASGGWRWMLNPMHHWVSARDRYMIGGLRFRRYVALSERVVADLQRYYGVPRHRIALIPNGVNLERFRPDPDDRAMTRTALGLPDGGTMLLFVGHEFDRKGLVHVIDALAALAPPVVLIVVGAGHAAPFEQQAARLGVRARVVFTGPRQDLPELYRAADAFVFPTSYESFSLTCMEAMACGLPVFATAVGGIEDYLQDGVNGRVIQPEGAAIAAVLGPVLQRPSKLATLREGALRTAAGYSWPTIAERYRLLLEEVRREMSAPAAHAGPLRPTRSEPASERAGPCN